MKKVFGFVTALAIAACFAFALPQKEEKKQFTVVIDAGHGGKDFGATHGTLTEKKIVMEIAKKIEVLNKDKNIVIKYTRTDDEFVDLSERAKKINELTPDLVLSLHINNNSKGIAKGMEFFVAESSEKAKGYGEKLAAKFNEKHYTVSEVKTAGFFLLKKTAAPTVFVELGYMSNESERRFLSTADGQNSVANTILEFIADIQ